MEGTMEVWHDLMVMGNWRRKYFVLVDNILAICDKKGGDVEARIHLKVATIDPKKEKPLAFVIYSGINKFKIRAPTAELKEKWVEVL